MFASELYSGEDFKVSQTTSRLWRDNVLIQCSEFGVRRLKAVGDRFLFLDTDASKSPKRLICWNPSEWGKCHFKSKGFDWVTFNILYICHHTKLYQSKFGQKSANFTGEKRPIDEGEHQSLILPPQSQNSTRRAERKGKLHIATNWILLASPSSS